MNINYIPLIGLCREIQGQQRGRQRFEEYINKMANSDQSDVEFTPLVLVNPMARDHVTKMLDDLIEIKADELAANAVEEMVSSLSHLNGDFKASIVVVDDAHGGWTNRYAYEYDLRRIQSLMEMNATQANRFWITGVLWSSESVSEQTVNDAIRSAVYRTAIVQKFQKATNLYSFLAQESAVFRLSKGRCPGGQVTLSSESIQTLETFFEETEKRGFIECVFGDVAAESLGYTKLGLEDWAGLRLAFLNASSNRFQLMPEELLEFVKEIQSGTK